VFQWAQERELDRCQNPSAAARSERAYCGAQTLKGKGITLFIYDSSVIVLCGGIMVCLCSDILQLRVSSVARERKHRSVAGRIDTGWA
jgi:hypothetical protein